MKSERPRSKLNLEIDANNIKTYYFSCSRSRNEVMMLLRRNPNMDVDFLKRKFPNVNIDKLMESDKIRGHYVPNV